MLSGNSADPDQLAHPCRQARICTGRFFKSFNSFLHDIYTYMAWVNSVDPDQLAQLCLLIRIYTGPFQIYLVIFYQNANTVYPCQSVCTDMPADLDLHRFPI